MMSEFFQSLVQGCFENYPLMATVVPSKMFAQNNILRKVTKSDDDFSTYKYATALGGVELTPSKCSGYEFCLTV